MSSAQDKRSKGVKMNDLAQAAAWKAREEELLRQLQDVSIRHDQLQNENTAARMEVEFLKRMRREGAQQTTVVSGVIGNLTEFSKGDDWCIWYERFEQYIAANEVAPQRQRSLFLTLIGQDAYQLLRNLCTPPLPASKPLEELADMLKGYLKPKPSVISERYRFKECRQEQGDDIRGYLAKLLKLSENCDFGATLEDSIRDQFVWGLASEHIKSRLIREKDLTYKSAAELALSMEMAGREVAEMTHQTREAVNRFGEAKKRKQASTSRTQAKQVRCLCCGKSGHVKDECRYKECTCHECGVKGHLVAVCSKKNNVNTSNVKSEGRRKVPFKSDETVSKQNYVGDSNDFESGLDRLCTLKEDALNNIKPIVVDINVQGSNVNFEIDTGSPISAVSCKFVEQSHVLKKEKLMHSDRRFKSFTGDLIIPKGVMNVSAKFKTSVKKLDLYVFKGDSAPIVGRDWLNALKIIELPDRINNVIVVDDKEVQAIVNEFIGVFSGKIGQYTGPKVKLRLKEGAMPVYFKPRPLPFAMKSKVEAELDRLEAKRILTPIENSEWATPIVAILKSNGSLRICGDYKITLNPHLMIDGHPIPRIWDLAARIKGKFFSLIDLELAYTQLELDDESKKLAVLSTHKGLYMPNRLYFGIASAPGLFQREMENLLGDIEGVVVFFDDVFIWAETREEHDRILREVLHRLDIRGLTANIHKCKFAQSSLVFLGYEFCETGIKVSSDKVKALSNLKEPSSVTELRSLLGMLNYYAKFIQNFAQMASPLFELMKKGVTWHWQAKHQAAFNMLKSRLASPEVLMSYDVQLPVKITCDASPNGLGAILSQEVSANVERPVAFASRVLTVAERNYSQLDREALAIVFAVKSFHQYVFGREFVMETDHKPLTFIFGNKKALPQFAASRVQRWAVFLSEYNFRIKHVKGKDNIPSDVLSRLHKDRNVEIVDNGEEFTYLKYVCEGNDCIDYRAVARETDNDIILSKVRNFIMYGWPDTRYLDEDVLAYKSRQLELTVDKGCVMWGYRLVIPTSLRNYVLKELHSVHFGIVKMKELARSYVWWPKIDSDLENVTKSCELCLKYAINPPRAVLHHWDWPENVNERIHADFCGPINGHMYLVITDAHSKWVDITEMSDITANSTIKAFRKYFCTWGPPKKVATDNGPTFISIEFKTYLKDNGVIHILSAPYHPASNGAAENAVKTFKSKFKLLLESKMGREEALCKYLFYYRTTPHRVTGKTPAELHIGRKLLTRFDLLKPSVEENAAKNQTSQKLYFRGNRVISFEKDETVMAKDYSKGNWCKAKVMNELGPLTYNVRTESNKVWKRHADQMRKCNVNIRESSERNFVECEGLVPECDFECIEANDNYKNESLHVNEKVTASEPELPRVNTPVPMLRRSHRVIKKPVKLDL